MHVLNKKLVWIGAGSATSSEFSFDNFDSIVLVDARKEACDELNESFADNVKVTIKQACISDRSEESKFFQCNVEELSALAKPGELKSLFPGVTVESSFDVDTISIIDFLKEECVDECTELFIDTPATSCKLVRKLFEGEFWERVTKLHVSIGTVPALYDGSADLTELSSLLKTKCFEEISRNSIDPDIPIVSFKLNENLKALEKLKSENSELQRQLTETRQNSEKIEHKANQLTLNLTEKNKLIESKDLEIQSLKTEIATYKADYHNKSSDCDELHKDLESSKASIQIIENELKEERAKVAKLTVEFDEQTNTLQAALADLEQTKARELMKTDELTNSETKLTELIEKFDTQASELKDAVQGIKRAEDNELRKNIELKDCQSKLEMLTNDLSQLRLNNEERERNLEANENKIAELNNQLLSKKAELDKQLESNSELIAINEKVSIERDKANEWRLENKKWAESLVEEKSLLETKLSDCEKQVSSLESNITVLKEECDTIATKEKSSARTLELNTKLMSKMQLDLDELRNQFKEKVQTEKALHELISELHLKLKQAQVFYHNLECQFPEIASVTKDLD